MIFDFAINYNDVTIQEGNKCMTLTLTRKTRPARLPGHRKGFPRMGHHISRSSRTRTKKAAQSETEILNLSKGSQPNVFYRHFLCTTR